MKRVVSVMTILLGLFVAGCETAPPQMIYVPADMLPQGSLARPGQLPSRFAGQTIFVAPVTGVGASNMQALSGALLGPSPLPGKLVIWGQTFHEALIKALGDSGLFAGVSRAGTSRYILRADILQQTTVGYGAAIKVRYALNDTQSGHDIWTQDITATYSFSLNPATFVAPGNTQYKALMRACGNNLGMLLAKLDALPPTEQ